MKKSDFYHTVPSGNHSVQGAGNIIKEIAMKLIIFILVFLFFWALTHGGTRCDDFNEM